MEIDDNTISPPDPSLIDDPVISDYNVPSDSEEDSIVDEAPSVNSETDSETVEWELIEKGTERGKPKLVNLTGYSYTISRVRKGTRYWKCSVQNKSNKCPAAVSEKAGVFTSRFSPHSSSCCRCPCSDETESSIQGKGSDWPIRHDPSDCWWSHW